MDKLLPDFCMDGVNEDEAVEIADGEAIVNALGDMAANGTFEDFDFELLDVETPFTLRCGGYAILDRYGISRLYIAYMHVGDGDTSIYVAYIVSNDSGEVLLVPEHDEYMLREMSEAMKAAYQESIADDETTETAKAAKPSKRGSKAFKAFKIIGCILLFPIWLLWKFIKALLSLFHIGFGDSKTVRAFKRGYNGTEDRKAYTVTNDMGCEETVYSDDGKTFYHADGSYAGVSDDNGKTLRK